MSSVRNLATTELLSKHVGPRTYVIREERTRVGPRSRFGDDRWDLRAFIGDGRRGRGDNVLKFDSIADPAARRTAKEFIWARLNLSVLHAERIAAPTARPIFEQICLVISELSALGVRRFVQFDAMAETKYTKWLQENRTQNVLVSRAATLRALFHYREHLTDAPQRMPFPRAPRPNVTGENRTPRVPEPVMGFLYQWAWRYVHEFADEILNAVERTRCPEPLIRPRVGEELADLLRRYSRLPLIRERGIPTASTRFGIKANATLIAEEIGLSPDDRYRRYAINRTLKKLRAFKFDFDVADEGSLLGLQGSGVAGIHLFWARKDLEAACYIVVAYLSGMRDSEVASLKPDCFSAKRDKEGGVALCKVRGIVAKGRGESGQPAEWVVAEEVGEAVRVITRLRALDQVVGDGSLFGGRGSYVMLLNGFLRRMVNTSRQHGGYDDGVIAQAAAWHLSTRQFRRTLAWYIANRPYGMVAGMIQYKHLSIRMFQGYAGTSKSGFRQEVEQESELRVMEVLFDRYSDWDAGLPLAGPGAGRLELSFRQVRESLGDLPGQIADGKRLMALLRDHVERTYDGPFNICSYDPDTALCLQTAKLLGVEGPVFSACNPALCPNSIVPPEYAGRWQAWKHDILELKEKALRAMKGRKSGKSIALSILERDLGLVDSVLVQLERGRRESNGEKK